MEAPSTLPSVVGVEAASHARHSPLHSRDSHGVDRLFIAQVLQERCICCMCWVLRALPIHDCLLEPLRRRAFGIFPETAA